jgi:RNA polymerase sigma-70 factor (ECF subfamily)
MKYRDAAKVMSVPVGTVKSRLHAAIQRLSQAWRDWQPSGRSEA